MHWHRKLYSGQWLVSTTGYSHPRYGAPPRLRSEGLALAGATWRRHLFAIANDFARSPELRGLQFTVVDAGGDSGMSGSGSKKERVARSYLKKTAPQASPRTESAKPFEDFLSRWFSD